MSSVWKIGTSTQSYAEAATFAALGLSNLVRTRNANAKDVVTFSAPAALALTADEAFTYSADYVVWKDGSRWFRGRCTTIPRSGSARDEYQTITLEGPWWYFENCAFLQAWNVYENDVETGWDIVSINKTRVILFQDTAGNRITSGEQVEEVIDYLIARGAPIAKGTIDAGITLPFDEQDNMSCEAVLSAVLRWTPDYVAWFDYSTESPTFNFRARANLTAVSQALTGGALSGLEITPRYDLQKPGVSLTYEITSNVDGVNYITYAVDSAGDDDAIDCVFGTFDLQGETRRYVRQKIVTDNFPDPDNAAALKAWWKATVPWMAAIADADLTLNDHAKDAGISAYSRYITEGTVQDWMDKDAVQGNVNVSVSAIIRDPDDASIVAVIVDRKVAWPCVATDAATLTYSRLTDLESGEPVPTGVAAALYSSWGSLHYDGRFVLTEDEVTGALYPGAKVNLTGGRTEWASMAALVQSVVESVDDGQTTVQFGAPAVLEADSLVALFRAMRGRRFAYHMLTREDPDVEAEEGDVTLSGKQAIAPADVSEGTYSRHRIPATNSDGDHDIDLNPEDVSHADAGDKANRTVKLREILVPEMSGSVIVVKRRQALCSDSYHLAIPLYNDHSWRFSPTSTTGGVVSPGLVWIGGVEKSVTDWPTDGILSGVTSTTIYWIAIDFLNATATWGSGGSLPSNTSTVHYWRVLVLTCAGSVITGVFQPWPCDIHALLNP